MGNKTTLTKVTDIDTCKKFLFVSAHPDDDVLVAGTMVQLVQAGWKSYEVCLTSGQKGDNKNGSTKNLGNIRQKELKTFLRKIGTEPPVTLNGNDGSLTETPKMLQQLVQVFRKVRPGIIVLPFKGDYHYDHCAAHLIGLHAAEIAFRGGQNGLGEKLEVGVILQTDGLNVLSNPTVFFDTSKTHVRKLELYKSCYPSQFSPKLERFCNGLAIMRGGRVGLEYAEAYELLQPYWYKTKPASSQILAEFLRAGQESEDYLSREYLIPKTFKIYT